MKVGDPVEIVDDAIKTLVGRTGVIGRFGSDGTTAWVQFPGGPVKNWGVWCSVSNLKKTKEKTADGQD